MPTHFISWNWVLLDLSEIAYIKLGCCVTHLILILDLSIKKCVPCDLKDLRPMTEEVANGLLRQVGALCYLSPFFFIHKFMFLSALYCLGSWMEFGE